MDNDGQNQTSSLFIAVSECLKKKWTEEVSNPNELSNLLGLWPSPQQANNARILRRFQMEYFEAEVAKCCYCTPATYTFVVLVKPLNDAMKLGE